MRLKKLSLILILGFTLFLGCNTTNKIKGDFTNITPAEVQIKETTYLLTDEIISNEDVQEEIGAIAQVHEIVSYMENDNPYKNPGKIFKLKDIEIEEGIGVEVNDKIYLAEYKKEIYLYYRRLVCLNLITL